jgi:glucuronoarabinoxylan endo-1,4-beta-xylanase
MSAILKFMRGTHRVADISWYWYAGVCFLFLSGLLLGFTLTRAYPPTQVTVDWNTTHQTIDGFGASATGYNDTFTSAQADRFFGVTTGLGLSLLRIRVIPDTINADCDCVSNSTPYTCVVGPKTQIVSGDLQIAKLAAARGVRLFAAAWSPPGAMKSSGGYCTKGSMNGTLANYATYAAALASFPDLLKTNGISIYAMSMQNEPNVENANYDTCMWTAQQVHDFIPYLSSALTASGFGSIKIAIPEESSWTFELMNKSMADPLVASQVGLIIGHAYGVERPAGIPSTNGRHVWQTEVSNSNRYDGSMSDAVGWAKSIHNYLSIGANAWMYWSLDCGPRYYNHTTNECLTDPNRNFAKRAYVLGQYAKFIRPGWQRIDVRNDGRLLVTAYKGPEKEFAIVVVNGSRWAVHNQSFGLNGIASQRSQVTPWLTSASASLSVQPPVSLTSNGTAFIYTIPARSVVTFRGQGD